MIRIHPQAGGCNPARTEPPNNPRGFRDDFKSYVDEPGSYRLPAGTCAGMRLDELPDDYLCHVAARNWHAEVRTMAELVIQQRANDAYPDDDNLQVAEPSQETAAAVLPLLCFLWEQAVRADLGHVEPGSAEAVALDRGVRHMRAIVTSYIGRAFIEIAEGT